MTARLGAHCAACRGAETPVADRCPACLERGRQEILAAAGCAAWPKVRVGRLLVGPGEGRWRQGVTLTPVDALPELAAALERGA